MTSPEHNFYAPNSFCFAYRNSAIFQTNVTESFVPKPKGTLFSSRRLI